MLRKLKHIEFMVAGSALALVAFVACGGDEEDINAPGDNIGEATEVSGAQSYVFDDESSLIYVQVFKEPGTDGHDHVMRATGYSATMNLDLDSPSACDISLSFEVAEMGVDEDEMRTLVGYGDALSDLNKNSIRNNMLADDQLNEDEYPTISYVSTGCEVDGQTLKVTGGLTIRGVTVSKSIDLSYTSTTEGLYSVGTMTLTHTEFGFSPYELFSSYKNANEISLTIDALATFAG